MGRRAGEPVWLPPRDRSAKEDWRLILPRPKGECDRGWLVAIGSGEIGSGDMVAYEGCPDCGSDMERSEVGVLSSTAEDDGCCWFACSVEICACCWRIILSRRFTWPSCSYSIS
jgi:hypothetical protein